MSTRYRNRGQGICSLTAWTGDSEYVAKRMAKRKKEECRHSSKTVGCLEFLSCFESLTSAAATPAASQRKLSAFKRLISLD